MLKVVWNFEKRLNGSVSPAAGISHFSLRKYHQLKFCNENTAKYITWEYLHHPKHKIKIFVFFPPRRAILNMLPVLCNKQCSILFSTNLHSVREKAMAPHSSTLAWKIPWTKEPGGLQSMGLQRVRHDWTTSLSLFTFMHWRRKWQPTPVFLPGESQARGSLVGCHLWGRTESDTTEVT